MKDILIRFTRNLAIISTIVAAIGFGLHFIVPQFSTPALPGLIFLFILTTYILFYILLKASTKKFTLFANYFMVASMLKILLLLIVISFYAYNYRSDAIRFTITMFALYLIYTIFEVFWLLKISRMK